MQAKNIRVITENELKEVNSKLALKKHGRLNQIKSGSVLEFEDGKKHYCIQLIDSNPYKPLTLLEKIGAIVKEVFDADEVYHFEKRIA